jgi:RNA polymerase-binding transcription factor DksA
VDKARVRALLDQERRRLEQLGRAVARDHGDAVAASRPEDPVDGAGRRIAEETSEASGERLEAFPLAELTVQEAAQRDRELGGGREDELGPQANLGVRTTPEA